jgi:hypothetical protein
VRVVARLSNSVLHQAMTNNIGPGAVLDVADLAAPSVVEAMLGRTAHTITAGGVEFVVATDTASRHGTLRELYGRLAPVAVIRGTNAPNPGEIVACPRLDDDVYDGDCTTLMAQADELIAQGITVGGGGQGRSHRSAPVRAFDSARAFVDDVNPMFYRALAVAAAVLITSTLVLRFGFQPGMGWVDALSFVTETMTTVGRVPQAERTILAIMSGVIRGAKPNTMALGAPCEVKYSRQPAVPRVAAAVIPSTTAEAEVGSGTSGLRL